MKKNLFTSLYFVIFCGAVNAQEFVSPLPSADQVAWQQMETYAFIHFGMNTFNDKEWGYGDADPKCFNPSRLDCEQWVRVLKQGGMKGVILTAKHHDGFCLWQTKQTDYSIASSPYKQGKGDLVRELSDACRKYGLKFGVYLSPWDRHQASYGTAEYVAYYNRQLEELLTGYGDLFEIWFDGANGGDGWYGGANEKRKIDRSTYYNFPSIFQKVRQLQPHAIIFSDGGPGCRWVGNEKGFAGETNWSFLRGEEVYPGYPHADELTVGHADGTQWTAAECDVSIRPGWFYHPSEDSLVKTPAQLREIYFNSVGRNATMLLNVPVNRDGLISSVDSVSIVDFANSIREIFSKDVLEDRVRDCKKETKTDACQQTITLTFKQRSTFNILVLQEDIKKGQRVKSFAVRYWDHGKWKPLPCAEQMTTIGYKRILRFDKIRTKRLCIDIKDSRAVPIISHIEAFYAPDYTWSK